MADARDKIRKAAENLKKAIDDASKDEPAGGVYSAVYNGVRKELGALLSAERAIAVDEISRDTMEYNAAVSAEWADESVQVDPLKAHKAKAAAVADVEAPSEVEDEKAREEYKEKELKRGAELQAASQRLTVPSNK